MGKESREVRKTLIGVGNLKYVQVKNVPFVCHSEIGESIDAQVLADIEKSVAHELIIRRLPLRGQEVEFLRNMLGLSQREFAGKLGLSHVSVLKWEKSANKNLDLVNEVAVKALTAGLLGMQLPASIEALSGSGTIPKKLILDFTSNFKKPKKFAA